MKTARYGLIMSLTCPRFQAGEDHTGRRDEPTTGSERTVTSPNIVGALNQLGDGVLVVGLDTRDNAIEAFTDRVIDQCAEFLRGPQSLNK